MKDDLEKAFIQYPQAFKREVEKEISSISLIDYCAFAFEALYPHSKFIKTDSAIVLCDRLEAVERGEVTRLLITLPTGVAKSLITNVIYPSWLWGAKQKPHLGFINCSHKESLAIEHLRLARQLIQSEWYQEIWPIKFLGDQNEKKNFQNDKMGSRRAMAVEGLTGYRANYILYDDPHSVLTVESDVVREKAVKFFAEVMPTRLNDLNTDVIIVIMQRTHPDDVAGLILKNNLKYEHLMMSLEFMKDYKCYSKIKPNFIENPKKEKVFFNDKLSIWQNKKYIEDDAELKIENLKCENRYCIDERKREGEILDKARHDKEKVLERKESMVMMRGLYSHNAQSQQRPTMLSGGLVNREDLKVIDIGSDIHKELMRNTIKSARGWDLAATVNTTSAYTCGVLINKTTDGKYLISHVIRFKGSPGKVETTIKSIGESDGIKVKACLPIDPGQAGVAQKIRYGQILAGNNFIFTKETKSKENRVEGFAAQCEHGNVYILRGDWNTNYIDELCAFPNSTFKDQVDATSTAFNNLIYKPTWNKNKKRVYDVR